MTAKTPRKRFCENCGLLLDEDRDAMQHWGTVQDPHVAHMSTNTCTAHLRAKYDAEREVSRKLAEALEGFVHWLAPLSEMAGSQWADGHSGEVDLNQAAHWSNECSKEARAALAQYTAGEMEEPKG
jgi:hypothetical protein